MISPTMTGLVRLESRRGQGLQPSPPARPFPFATLTQLGLSPWRADDYAAARHMAVIEIDLMIYLIILLTLRFSIYNQSLGFAQ